MIKIRAETNETKNRVSKEFNKINISYLKTSVKNFTISIHVSQKKENIIY